MKNSILSIHCISNTPFQNYRNKIKTSKRKELRQVSMKEGKILLYGLTVKTVKIKINVQFLSFQNSRKNYENRMIKFLKKYNLISDKQYGFRVSMSTQDAIACLTAKNYEAIDETTPACL